MKQGDNQKTIMEKTNKTLKANNILWVEYWIHEIDNSLKGYDITAYQEGKGWTCEIDLPLIDGFVRVRTNTEVDAMINAANRAAELIDRFMKEHPEIEIRNIFKNMPYEIESDENGRFKSIYLNTEFRKKLYEESSGRVEQSSKILTELDEKLSKLYGDDLFIEIISKSVLENDKEFLKATREIENLIREKYNCILDEGSFIDLGERIAVVGRLTNEVKRLQDLNKKWN